MLSIIAPEELRVKKRRVLHFLDAYIGQLLAFSNVINPHYILARHSDTAPSIYMLRLLAQTRPGK